METQTKKSPASKGKCNLCGRTFGKSGMTKHLMSCIQKERASQVSSPGKKGREIKTLHLVVEGRYRPAYWMHLEARSDATLEDLDLFLRHIWLECCGHMSAFTIQGHEYTSSGPFGELLDWQETMDIALGEVLSPGMKFEHEYDFGTTTHLKLKVVGENEGHVVGEEIRVLARNDPPPIMCQSCGKEATKVCRQCLWSGAGWLCDECARKHECGEDMFLPVVNSPRVGMCGYTGNTSYAT